MKRWYMIVRVTGYIAALAGLILFTTGRQDAASARTLAGGVLLAVGFVAFFCSYLLYTMIRLRRGTGIVRETGNKNGP